jgi:hypothetical protein
VPSRPTLSIDDALWRETHAAQMAQDSTMRAPVVQLATGQVR